MSMKTMLSEFCFFCFLVYKGNIEQINLGVDIISRFNGPSSNIFSALKSVSLGEKKFLKSSKMKLGIN